MQSFDEKMERVEHMFEATQPCVVCCKYVGEMDHAAWDTRVTLCRVFTVCGTCDKRPAIAYSTFPIHPEEWEASAE